MHGLTNAVLFECVSRWMVTNCLASAEGAREESFGLLASLDMEIVQKTSKFIRTAEQRQKPKIASNAWAYKCFIFECAPGKKVRKCLAHAEGARDENMDFFDI